MVEKIDFKKYCHSSNEFSFDIDGMKFVCEEMTVSEEANYYNYYIDPNGKHNVAKLGLIRSTKLIVCPFNLEWIKYLINEDKYWEALNVDQKINFLGKLETSFASQIFTNINEHYINKRKSIKN